MRRRRQNYSRWGFTFKKDSLGAVRVHSRWWLWAGESVGNGNKHWGQMSFRQDVLLSLSLSQTSSSRLYYLARKLPLIRYSPNHFQKFIFTSHPYVSVRVRSSANWVTKKLQLEESSAFRSGSFSLRNSPEEMRSEIVVAGQLLLDRA